MPLSTTTLKALIKSNLVSGGLVASDQAGLDAAAQALAESVVDHVVANLTVVIPIGAVVVAATGGVPNPAPIPCTVT